jgi:hypothetical protein
MWVGGGASLSIGSPNRSLRGGSIPLLDLDSMSHSTIGDRSIRICPIWSRDAPIPAIGSHNRSLRGGSIHCTRFGCDGSLDDRRSLDSNLSYLVEGRPDPCDRESQPVPRGGLGLPNTCTDPTCLIWVARKTYPIERPVLRRRSCEIQMCISAASEGSAYLATADQHG